MPPATLDAPPVSLSLPRPVPQQRIRQPKKNIPQTTLERNRILHRCRAYVAEHQPVPPMPADEIKVHADRLVAELGCGPAHRDYVGVLLNNEMWREQLAGVPFERRLLPPPEWRRAGGQGPPPFRES